jgi:prostaglandin-endoperoxide synthase 2
LRSYNDYREAFGLTRLISFEQLTRDADVAGRLRSLYRSIDNLELVVGLFAEAPPQDGLFGDLLLTMVAYDAFTQIYTNPLLSRSIHTAEHLTPNAVGRRFTRPLMALRRSACRDAQK